MQNVEDKYVRQRIAPTPGDDHYLVLSDLLLAMKEFAPAVTGRVLDYGCDQSPYRSLFNASIYHRADLAGGKSLDFEFTDDSLLTAGSAEYDCVLSSQVLEHVPSPNTYLQECRRVLKPGGTLILSTHGLFQDHNFPGDYWRWTATGLAKLVEASGFRVDKLKKLTTGPRAAVYFAERAHCGPKLRKGGISPAIALFGLPALQRLGARRRHQACDACFTEYRVANGKATGHDTYVTIAFTASRL